MTRFSIILLLLCGGACRPASTRPQRMELWYWHHSYLVTDQAVQQSKERIDRAARAGYTGLALWDTSFAFLGNPSWPEANVRKLKEVVDYATARGLRVMPAVTPYGYSNDVLKQHVDWAEAQRVVGTRFRVNDAGNQLVQLKSMQAEPPAAPLPFLSRDVDVVPWRQYHIHLAMHTRAFKGIAQLEVSDGPAVRLDANLRPAPDQDWTLFDYTLNSQNSTVLHIGAGIFGSHEGELQVGQFTMEETGLVYTIRRAGTPLRLYDADRPGSAFTEGSDFNPVHDQKLLTKPEFSHDNFHDPGPVTIPPGSRLRPGQVVAMDYYAVIPIYDEEVSVCLTEPAVERWMIANARASAALIPSASGLLLSHDEIRQMNSCASCRARNLTAGELLADHISRLTKQLSANAPLYIWNDMFDPLHNAHDHFYLVEGTLAGSWKGLGPEVTVMNWNLDHLHNSLLWFSGDDPRQPVPHRQIIAGFYDPADHDGAGAARREWEAAYALPGVVGIMYTTWTDDYSQLEPFAAAAREGWAHYRATRPR